VHTLFVLLTIVLSLFMLVVGPLRVIGIPIARSDAKKFGIPFPIYRLFGVVEVLGAIALVAGLAVPVVSVVAAIVLALLGIGAVVVHVRAREPAVKVTLATLTAAATVVLAVLSIVRLTA
jgi:putative oxidoreductase